MAGRGVVWSQEESCVLIEIWKDDYIKRQLSSTHKNIKVFILFAQKMKERGYNRTALQCRVKVKKLRQKYMSTRDKIHRSGESAEIKDSCPFYEDLDEILGASACACPTNVVEGGSVDMENEEEQGKGIILHPYINAYIISTLWDLLLTSPYSYNYLQWLHLLI